MPDRLSNFVGYDIYVQVGAQDVVLWRAVESLPPADGDFRSRAELGTKPRIWNDYGGNEDACRYTSISAWGEPDLAKAEAKRANEIRVSNGKPVRFSHVVPFAVEGPRGNALSVDIRPDGHCSVWGEARHLREASYSEEALPIDP